MPIYEYQCQACDHRLEALQKISDAPKLDCPACGESALKKQVSAVAFRLKGSGWYETDFKTGDKKNLAGDQQKKAPAAEKPAAPKKAEPKTESKAESKADSKTSSTA